MYSINDLSKLAGVSRRTIYNDIDKGLLSYYRIGKRIKFSKEEVDSYCESKRKAVGVIRWQNTQSKMLKSC